MRQLVAVSLWLAGALLLSACAGSGDGLDQNGQPIGSSSSSSSGGGSSSGSGSGSSGATVSFQTIQDQVFTPICAQCHAGASAPQGLQLSQGEAYAMIVGVPSQEQPALKRIAPGDPDNSYLVQKIMGTAAVGAQMPAGCPITQPCLTTATIDLIRQWVSEGAPPPPSSSNDAGNPGEQ
ncbi:MAG: hypothetical protein JWR07_4906 [Nevskia sp.]|nr:hypothetical protein [Nevskia sp.]